MAFNAVNTCSKSLFRPWDICSGSTSDTSHQCSTSVPVTRQSSYSASCTNSSNQSVTQVSHAKKVKRTIDFQETLMLQKVDEKVCEMNAINIPTSNYPSLESFVQNGHVAFTNVPLIPREPRFNCVHYTPNFIENPLMFYESNQNLVTPVESNVMDTSASISAKGWKVHKKQRPKRFQCPHCQVSFSNNGQLKGHIRIHTGNFFRQFAYVKQQNVCIGERPFACDHQNCGKTFTRNEELTRHKRIHTGLRPYSCSVCAKRFGRKDHLKKHVKTHQRNAILPLALPFTPALPTLPFGPFRGYNSWFSGL
ncbi:Huckebein-like protein [Leptotrombidium deliense]|uniref:Huckebein-like protein n=1 Tax=Leptotrombidium deliense TaxID=299467 RepID=A0A443S6E6_9ACAR|nr:Huckebein-like protein [Leptotrombidium deliense]